LSQEGRRALADLPHLHNAEEQRSDLWIFVPGPVKSIDTELDVNGRPVRPPMLLIQIEEVSSCSGPSGSVAPC
jgi:hypothetical protein